MDIFLPLFSEAMFVVPFGKSASSRDGGLLQEDEI